MTLIVAHRGGAGLWPENSPTAFRGATRLPVDQVEFDIHPSRDGRLVVMHDPLVDRTTNGTGAIVERDWSDLSRLNLNGTEREAPPLLEDVLDIFRPTGIDLRIELKADRNRCRYDGLERRIMESLGAGDMVERAILTCFQLESVIEVLTYPPPKGAIWIVSPGLFADLGWAQVVRIAVDNAVPAIGLRHDHIDATVVESCRDAGLGIGSWAVNEAADMERLFGLGIDSFTTDRPDQALDIAR